jgi:valyl-tRNA synthetase
VRNLRAENKVAPGRPVQVIVRGTPEQLELVEKLVDQIRPLARIESLTLARNGARPKVAASAVVQGAEVFLPLEGLIDLDAERERLVKEADRLMRDLEGTRRKLSNSDFLAKAKPEVMERERQRLTQLEETLAKLKRAQESLHGAKG